MRQIKLCNLLLGISFLPFLLLSEAQGETLYVSTEGNDLNQGAVAKPLRNVNTAAQRAKPGDVIIVRGGVYRETISCPRGGESDKQRITFIAAPKEKVILKGSERIRDWVSSGQAFHTVLPAKMFQGYNPFAVDAGEVFLNGTRLKPAKNAAEVSQKPMSWHFSAKDLILTANFGPKVDPKEQLVEVHVREQVFAPAYGLGFITIDGIVFEHCGNKVPESPSDEEGTPRKGMVSMNGGHDWVLQNCEIRGARSIGISFGWSGKKQFKESGVKFADLGRHVIRNNHIHDNGVVGLGDQWSPFTRITDNVIEDNGFVGPESLTGYGGLKALAFLGGLIEGNLFRNNKGLAIWLDNTYQGSRITRNVFIKNNVYLEMEIGPVLIDNNVFLSKASIKMVDGAGAIVAHNLFSGGGKAIAMGKHSKRTVRAFKANSTTDTGKRLPADTCNNSIFNNLFVDTSVDLPAEKGQYHDNISDFNVFYGGSGDKAYDKHSIAGKDTTGFSFSSEGKETVISFALDAELWRLKTSIIDEKFNGGLKKVTDWPIPAITHDFFGKPISATKALAGPFVTLEQGPNRIRITVPSADPVKAVGDGVR